MTLQQYQENTFAIEDIFVTKNKSEDKSPLQQSNIISLYSPYNVFPESIELGYMNNQMGNLPSLNIKIVNEIATKLGLIYTIEKETPGESPVCFANSPEVRPEFRLSFTTRDILDYIYSVYYSPAYREKYQEFLETHSVRIPYPEDASAFWELVKLGSELRQAQVSAQKRIEKITREIDKTGAI